MATAVDVVILFVGLALWSQELPNDCGVKAILPSVQHATCDESAHGTAASPSSVSQLRIQKHQAAIVFPRYSFDSHTGWGAPEELPGQTLIPDSEKLLFVRLNGDRVSFLTGGADNGPASLDGLRLASIKKLSPARHTLRPEFRSPGYSGAAAVVSLPVGTVKACLSVPGESVGRLDTRVTMTANGTLGITSNQAGNPKELRLKRRSANEKIHFMIVNLPESFFQGTAEDQADGVSHMNVYLAMTEGTGDWALTPQQWWDRLEPNGIPLCNPAPTLAAMGTSPLPDALMPVWASGADFECSNTQWP